MNYLRDLDNLYLIDEGIQKLIDEYKVSIIIIKKAIVNEDNGEIQHYSSIDVPYENILFSIPRFPGGTKPESIFFYISSFPGNCSAVVLDNFQHYCLWFKGSNEIIDRIFDFTEKLVGLLGYGSIFVSVTVPDAIRVLETKGFNLVSKNYNPHSDNNNYFLVKVLEKIEK